MAFSPDGKILAVGSGEPIYQFNKAKEVRLWDLATERVAWVLPEPPAAVTSVAFSPEGKLLAVACADAQNQMNAGVAILWDLTTRQAVATLKGHKGMIWCVTFSPDGKTLATASHDELVKLWDPVTGQERATLKGHTGPVSSLGFSRNNKLLASASGAPVPVTSRGGEVILCAPPGGRGMQAGARRNESRDGVTANGDDRDRTRNLLVANQAVCGEEKLCNVLPKSCL